MSFVIAKEVSGVGPCTWRCCNAEALSYAQSSDGSVRLCRYHSAIILARSYGGPDIILPISMWAAAQGRPDVPPPLVSPEVADWCAAGSTR